MNFYIKRLVTAGGCCGRTHYNISGLAARDATTDPLLLLTRMAKGQEVYVVGEETNPSPFNVNIQGDINGWTHLVYGWFDVESGEPLFYAVTPESHGTD